MLYSFVVPIYNVKKYLKRCIESIINQTYNKIEILLIDDGSTDNSLEICYSYAKIDSRIRVFHKENGGLSDTRNYGINEAKGDYIIFVDSDDFIEKDTCEKMLKYCNGYNEIIIGNAKDFNKLEKKIENYYCNETLTGEEFLLKGYENSKISMAAWLYIYKRTFLVKNMLKFKCGIYHEDEEFTPRALLKAKKVCTTEVFFYNYDIRENSITMKNDKRKNAEDLYNTFCELEVIYNNISNRKLRKYLLNSISDKYLSLYQSGRLYKYGEKYIHRRFVLNHAKLKKTKVKAFLYCVSPRLYYFINLMAKNNERGKK